MYEKRQEEDTSVGLYYNVLAYRESDTPVIDKFVGPGAHITGGNIKPHDIMSADMAGFQRRERLKAVRNSWALTPDPEPFVRRDLPKEHMAQYARKKPFHWA